MRRPSVGCHTSYREGGQGHEVFPEKFFPRFLEPLLRGRSCTSVPGHLGTRPSVQPRARWAGEPDGRAPASAPRPAPTSREVARPATRSHRPDRSRTRRTLVVQTRQDEAGSGLVLACLYDLDASRATSSRDVRPRREMCDLAGSRPRRARPSLSPDQSCRPTSPVLRPARSRPAQPTATSGRCGVVNPAAPWGTRGVSPVAVPTALTPAATAVEACRLARSAIAAK